MTAADTDRRRVALLDACTLVPIRLATTLLWLAEAGLFEVLWSDAVLAEVQRTLPKVGITPAKAAHRVEVMRSALRLWSTTSRISSTRCGAMRRTGTSWPPRCEEVRTCW